MPWLRDPSWSQADSQLLVSRTRLQSFSEVRSTSPTNPKGWEPAFERLEVAALATSNSKLSIFRSAWDVRMERIRKY